MPNLSRKWLCALCRQHAELQKSHIIPNAYIKPMKLGNNGKLTPFDSANDTEARQSIESWSEKMLCKKCEQQISQWERSSIEMLRKTGKSIAESGSQGGLIVGYNYPILRLFLLSILLRAAVSTLDQFKEVILPTDFQEQLRLDLHSNKSPNKVALSCRMMKIVDPAKHFTSENFEKIAISPSSEPCGDSGKCSFIFGGYRIEHFIPRAPKRFEKRLEFCSIKTRSTYVCDSNDKHY